MDGFGDRLLFAHLCTFAVVKVILQAVGNNVYNKLAGIESNDDVVTLVTILDDFDDELVFGVKHLF